MNTSFGLGAFQWRGVWGERQTPALQTGKGYCANLGHQEDETGLVYMRARYYEPTTGRFISEDPARDGVNWCLYADGDPVGKVDAYGLFVIELPNGFWIRFDSAYSQEGTGELIRDLTWGMTKGGQRQTLGSIRPDGSIKHGAEMPEKLKELIRNNSNAFKKAMKQGGYGLGAYVLLCSLDSAFLSDPLAFGEIVDILGGEWDLFGGGIRVGAS
jgi:RHS repeat-associated protein